jgi:hypothetical protein
MPFLLLNGHHSWVGLPFLKYINDDAHKWKVCIGVPYSTHLWQVQDASELNGCYKIALAKAKQHYLTFKPIGEKKFVLTDIIPLVNHAWHRSFTRKDVAVKAVSMVGVLLIMYY